MTTRNLVLGSVGSLFAALGLFVLAGGSHFAAAEDKAKSPEGRGSAVFSCKGEEAGGKAAKEYRGRCEKDPFFEYAAKIFGPPSSCEIRMQQVEGQDFGTLTYHFADGSTLKIETNPPETTVTDLSAAKGFRDEKAAREFLMKQAREVGLQIDWKGKPEKRKETNGTEVQTFWDRTSSNLGADLVQKGGKLVGIGIHMAL